MPRERTNPDYRPPVKPEDREIDVSDIPFDREEDKTLAIVIDGARDLLEQKQKLLGQIHESRLLARMLVNRGAGDRDQVDWVRRYFPEKGSLKAQESEETNGEGDEE